jgi:hypothetical protein
MGLAKYGEFKWDVIILNVRDLSYGEHRDAISEQQDGLGMWRSVIF